MKGKDNDAYKDILQEWSNAMNDLVAECLIKDFDQRPFMQVSVM